VAANIAAVGTIAVEIGIGVLMLCGQGRLGRAGTVLGLLYHLSGAALPPPNGHVAHSILYITRYFWFAPEVGPGRYCSPLHPACFEPSFLESAGIL
jgi:hypothetical protein